jgi:hypothetical protein
MAFFRTIRLGKLINQLAKPIVVYFDSLAMELFSRMGGYYFPTSRFCVPWEPNPPGKLSMQKINAFCK